MKPFLHLAAVSALCVLSSVTASLTQELAIRPQYDQVGHFHESLAPVRIGDRWGFIDRDGRTVVPFEFSGIRRGRDGRFGVQKGGKWGFVNSSGEMVIAPQYDDVGSFKDGVAPALKNGRWGFVTPLGDIETPFLFDAVGPRQGLVFPAMGGVSRIEPGAWRIMFASPGLQPVAINGPLGEQDVSLRVWFRTGSQNATRVSGFSENIAVASVDNGQAQVEYYEGPGALVRGGSDGIFQSIRRNSEGWAAATRDGQSWGYIDEAGKFWDPGSLQGAREFSMGVAPVKSSGKWGYMTKQRRYALRPTYDRAYSFHEGYATMRIGEKRGFLKITNGRIGEYVSPQYEDVFRFQEGLAPVKMNGKWGFLSNGDRSDGSTTRSIVDVLPE